MSDTVSHDAFEYDARNRLTASCFGVTSGATNCTGAANKITYAYDKVSNRTQEVRTGNVGNTGTIDYTYNSADQLTQTSKGGVNTSYTYDANGNQASAGSRTFTSDLADRLVSTTNAGTTTTYSYDGDDRRVASSVGGGGADLRFVWDPLAASGIPELALERDSSGNLVRRYLGGPLGAVSFMNASATFYYQLDPLGTVTDVTDASGNAQWKYEYEGYGAARSATNVSGSAPEHRLRFDGQYLDSESGLYHLRARSYDSATGRFGAIDPAESPLTYEGAYVYAGARPSVLTDPLGLTATDDDDDPELNGAEAAAEFARATFRFEPVRPMVESLAALYEAGGSLTWREMVELSKKVIEASRSALEAAADAMTALRNFYEYVRETLSKYLGRDQRPNQPLNDGDSDDGEETPDDGEETPDDGQETPGDGDEEIDWDLWEPGVEFPFPPREGPGGCPIGHTITDPLTGNVWKCVDRGDGIGKYILVVIGGEDPEQQFNPCLLTGGVFICLAPKMAARRP